jgi:catechol 2,3-dioxygenase-like lactoylglutathione lyase family enzyme
MSLGHVGLSVTSSQYKAMRDFYVATLSPLGYKIYLEKDCKYLGLRGSNGPDFWLHCGGEDVPSSSSPPAAGKTHVAFAVTNKTAVDSWYSNAL